MNRMKYLTLACAGLVAASSALASPATPKGPVGEDFCSIECGNFECWVAQKLFCPRNAPTYQRTSSDLPQGIRP